MNTKPWYQSKTVWFNALTILIAIATYFGYTPDQQVSTNVASFLVVVSPIVNLYLRHKTTQGVSYTG